MRVKDFAKILGKLDPEENLLILSSEGVLREVMCVSSIMSNDGEDRLTGYCLILGDRVMLE